MLALSHAVSGCRIYKNYYLQVKLFFEKLAPNYFLFVVVNYPLVHDYKVQDYSGYYKKKKKSLRCAFLLVYVGYNQFCY